MNYLVLQWIATALSILGAVFLAFKFPFKFIVSTWVLWIFSAIFFSYIFFETKQYGLMIGHMLNILISFFGLYQYIYNKHTLFLTKFLLGISSFTFLFVIFNTFLYFNTFLIYYLEWISGLSVLIASLVMASKSKFSIYAWLFWLIGNSLGAYIGFTSELYGYFFLQSTFFIINIIGLFNWFKDYKLKKNG